MIKIEINKRMKIILCMIGVLLFGIITSNISQATIQDINQIDESKYPGYKEKLRVLQNQYPNWNIRVLYTGLDWNNVIDGEYQGHGYSPSNLVPQSYNGEWRCEQCGDTPYDSGSWRCASKKAIAYYMDPRNYLDQNSIFQFQDLTSTEVNKADIMHMTYGTFLNNEECINAIFEASQQNQISAYHLVTRIIHEQTRKGSALSLGQGYNGQYIGVYNFFNIGASGNTEEEVILNGLKTAADRGWTTRRKSIIEGSQTIGNNYLKKGQNTLYFEKFNVVVPPYYQHQYQQNLMVAKEEASTMLKQYKDIFNVAEARFDFIIPLYENMPKDLSQKPLKIGEAYEGNIVTQVKSINFNEVNKQSGYISGSAIVAEWINGIANVPKAVPNFRIKSTDGTVSESMYAKQIIGNEYYFDKYFDSLDPMKQYVIEIEASNVENVSRYKTSILGLSDQYLGINQNLTLEIKNGKIQYQYVGNVNTGMQSLELKQGGANGAVPYITGNIVIVEWVNGQSKVPSTLPAMYLVATDGSIKEALYVESKGGNTYYFDKYIEGLSTGKQYKLQVELTETNNISNQKKQNVTLQNSTLGVFKNKNMIVQDNKIQFPYSGDIKAGAKNISFRDNQIRGTIEVTELINGNVETRLEVNPIVKMIATDQSVTYSFDTIKTSNNEYDFVIDNDKISIEKDYQFEVKTTNPNNQSEKQEEKITFQDQIIGKYTYLDVKIDNEVLKWNYVGNISSELKRFSLKKAASGAAYVNGEIVIVEWIDGKSTVPKVLPKIRLKSTDGTKVYESFITPTGTNTYYFDQYIEDIDHSKEYIYELESGNPKNISTSKSKQITIPNQELGIVKEQKAKIEDNKLMFVPDTYIGNINSDLKRFSLKKAASGAAYVNGEIVIVEWINGKSTVPEVLPKIRLKSTDGTKVYESFITPTGTNTYYFDQYIEDIDHSKEYIYELESGNPKNVSDNKSMQITIQNQELGMVKGQKAKIENNKLMFVPDTYIGNINSELKRFSLKKAASGAAYVNGEIVIVEWIDGKSTVPEVLPKIRLKSTDGTKVYESFITPTGTNTYYFDQYIEDIDHSKEYIYELESGNPKNVSTSKSMQITIRNQELGIVKNQYNARIEENTLKFSNILVKKVQPIQEVENEVKHIEEIQENKVENKEELQSEHKIIEDLEAEEKVEEVEKEEINPINLEEAIKEQNEVKQD